jgi:hypothetical protein
VTDDRLRVLHAPLHAPSAKQHPPIARRSIRHQQPTSVGLTEAYGILPELAKMTGYRMIMETGGRDKRRGQKDTPILARRDLVSLGSGQVFGSEASTPLRIAPERWLTYSTVRVPGIGAVCHICLHPHAGIQDKDTGKLRTDIDRGRKADQQLKVLAHLLDFAKAMGWARVVTGDLNFRDRPTTGASPYKVLRDHGLTVDAHGLDVIAGDKALHLDVREVHAPSSITDHPWLLGVAA